MIIMGCAKMPVELEYKYRGVCHHWWDEFICTSTKNIHHYQNRTKRAKPCSTFSTCNHVDYSDLEFAFIFLELILRGKYL